MPTYSHFEIDRTLSSMTVLVDTREQETPALRARLEGFGCPSRRYKLDYGDYSCEVTKPDGTLVSAAPKVCVERKMNLDELCGCFTSGRERFEREFLRAREDGAKVYLLVENASWEKVLSGAYRSRMKPEALTASLLAWCARYSLTPVFCAGRSTGKLIAKILRYEVKILLERGEL
jgi:ERCC4-type nuclease